MPVADERSALALARAGRNQRAHEAEWDASPLGRLGRHLLPEVDRYVEFFAIARGYAEDRHDWIHRADGGR